MSIRVSSWVWENSQQKNTALLLMLAIADTANDEGVCWPGISRLAKKSRTSTRNVKLLLHKLEGAEELEILRGVGRHHTNVYGVKAYREELREKGEDTSPLEVYAIQKGEIQRTKGEIQRKEKVKRVSPKPLVEPSVDTSEVVESLPDDVTARCLLLLQEIKGFPRNQAENAMKLREYRDEFLSVDAVEVCRDFKAYIAEKPFKSKDNPRLRLRNFFKTASRQPARNGYQRNKSIAVVGAREEDYDPEEYRFHE
jgi:hypothetical protein